LSKIQPFASTNMPTETPSGTVTFLFTDVEGSTKLAQEYPNDMPGLLARHDAILRQAVQAHKGYVFRIVADSFLAAFHTVSDALNATLEAQRALAAETWSPAPVKARMGIHTGPAEWNGKDDEPDYEGYATLAMASRVMSAGHGGQILLSEHARELAKDRPPHNAGFENLGEYHLKDFLQPQTIYQLTAPDLPCDFPPLKTLKTVRNNLPLNPTPFIGRERELAESQEKLASSRLLTLIGPGGTGKTRLSLQAGFEQIGNFTDGVWLVELAPISDAGLIFSAIAATFNLREVQGVPLSDTIMDYLRGKELLLLLDNCEHLVEPSAHIADQLLRTCPYLKIIASSREALGIDGETVYRVPSLQDDEATRLFVERATKTEPRFHVTEDNASSVAQICSRLDGIPLAIELAAARVKLFTPVQIAERLDDRFKLLTGGSRTALPRQQTLRALIDWSYVTLNETEQRALRGLAVFAGGWTFEAAEGVIGETEAMDGLSGLVNKSLVNVEEQEGKSRYSFLETIRQYAMDRLLESGKASPTRDRHLDYFLTLAERADEGVYSKETKYWLKIFEREYENLRSALRWGLENDPFKALTLAGFLNNYWLLHGQLAEGRRWCEAALNAAEKLPQDGGDVDQVRARGFLVLAMLCANQGEHHTALGAAEKAIGSYRQAGNSKYLARALIIHGSASAFAGDLDQALASFRESETISREMDYKFELAWVLDILSYVTFEVHGAAAAEEINGYLQESLALSQQIDVQWVGIASKELLSRQAYYRGDTAQALKYADEVLSYYQDIGNMLTYNGFKSGMAHAFRWSGNFEEALATYRQTILAYKEMGHRGAVAHQLECFAFIAKAQSQAERAVRLLGSAEALREKSNSHMTPQEHIEYDRQVAGLRAGIDENAFALLWSEGRSMTMEQAIQLALENNVEST
jgi:predicted ATPase/class 3 adenylate cyclase